MKTSAVCPAFGGKLGFWTVFQALTPFRLRCPRCKAKLKVVLRGLWVLFMTIGSLLLLWALIEVSMALLFFHKANFVEVKKKRAP